MECYENYYIPYTITSKLGLRQNPQNKRKAILRPQVNFPSETEAQHRYQVHLSEPLLSEDWIVPKLVLNHHLKQEGTSAKAGICRDHVVDLIQRSHQASQITTKKLQEHISKAGEMADVTVVSSLPQVAHLTPYQSLKRDRPPSPSQASVCSQQPPEQAQIYDQQQDVQSGVQFDENATVEDTPPKQKQDSKCRTHPKDYQFMGGGFYKNRGRSVPKWNKHTQILEEQSSKMLDQMTGQLLPEFKERPSATKIRSSYTKMNSSSLPIITLISENENSDGEE